MRERGGKGGRTRNRNRIGWHDTERKKKSENREREGGGMVDLNERFLLQSNMKIENREPMSRSMLLRISKTSS